MATTIPVCSCPDPQCCIHAEARRSLTPRGNRVRLAPASPKRIAERNLEETLDGDRQWWNLPSAGEPEALRVEMVAE